MEPIDLSFLEYPGVIIKGDIYESKDPDVLLQDLIEVELPNGEIIDIGWLPEHDTTGSYIVSVFDYSTMVRSSKFVCDRVYDALAIVRQLICQRIAPLTSDAGDSYTDSYGNHDSPFTVGAA